MDSPGELSAVRDLVDRRGHYAECAGRRFPILAHGEGWVTVLAAQRPGEPESLPAGATETGTHERGPWARLPLTEVDRRVKVSVAARWRGEPVAVGPRVGDEVVLYYDRSPERARELGMTGDQYNGWEVRAGLTELTDVEITEREY